MAAIDRFFRILLESDGSDLHLMEGQPPKMRIHGHLAPVADESVLTNEIMKDLLEPICPSEDWQQYIEIHDLDFAYEMPGEARFRANYYRQHHGMAAVFRLIPFKIDSLDDLGAPPILRAWSKERSGLYLVTGPTGSGKSTTLAAFINEMNNFEKRYIVTLEEPVEFVHTRQQSFFCQREVGRDTPSFAEGLRDAGRMDCDVILVGELRDYETIGLALSAATMGKLVLGTLHTNSAVKTIDRIVDVFPADEQWKARNMLADTLGGVCAQVLLRTADGKGRVAAHEILVRTQGLSTAIRDGNISQIRNMIQSGRGIGMQLLDDSIAALLEAEVISPEEAYMKSQDKSRFEYTVEEEDASVSDISSG
ncbi:PilT/PilU family type 4a pilus ATPase [bacterium]|nr:PilT/PilU family type 4a pilus ATPase [bacterium]